MSNRLVADTIAEQLGGYGKLEAMINAKNFAYDDNSLTFKFSGNKNINCIKINLEPNDTYTVTYYKIKRLDFAIVSETKRVYAGSLKTSIRNNIGLRLSLA